MKQYIYLLVTLGILFFNSCMNETLERDNATVVEGVPVAVSLSFTRGDIPKVTTKAALSETEETKVYDICLFIFNKSKKLEY